VNKQTDKQTNRQTDRHRGKHNRPACKGNHAYQRGICPHRYAWFKNHFPSANSKSEYISNHNNVMHVTHSDLPITGQSHALQHMLFAFQQNNAIYLITSAVTADNNYKYYLKNTKHIFQQFR